ncbi:F0F1 ATP synthase subunit B family protein [Lichenicoccus roseus]|uniref:ATP synthase subunit b n=1 Tax=Lichenicoccus roseus TaxID=2683649 RepID=A0A5R9JD47_9PROT|nr:F0F1 ATP synthase subunit B [Lichenicoccus roseus]TLU74693.1 F0F1 ATP synthase subunit B [Lichenicoccus roseus]
MLHEPRFWYSVAFVLFFVVLGRRIARPLLTILDNRAATVRQDLDEAARLKREAEQMLADAQRERDAALAEAAAMVERSRQEATRIAEQARQDADTSARRRERMAQDRIHAAERAAVDEVRSRAAEIASEAARAIVAEILTAEHDSALIDRAIAALPSSLAGRRAA